MDGAALAIECRYYEEDPALDISQSCVAVVTGGILDSERSILNHEVACYDGD
jgi:hypothetical protein